jgi:hypothetical protein
VRLRIKPSGLHSGRIYSSVRANKGMRTPIQGLAHEYDTNIFWSSRITRASLTWHMGGAYDGLHDAGLNIPEMPRPSCSQPETGKRSLMIHTRITRVVCAVAAGAAVTSLGLAGAAGQPARPHRP